MENTRVIHPISIKFKEGLDALQRTVENTTRDYRTIDNATSCVDYRSKDKPGKKEFSSKTYPIFPLVEILIVAEPYAECSCLLGKHCLTFQFLRYAALLVGY
jgi:hypothetical protein